MDAFEQWLQQHGLESLFARLSDNDVDLDIITDLAEKDLADIGLTLGQRKRQLRAVATLDRVPLNHQLVQPCVEDRASVETGVAERRQLTVVFCDLVGSTEMSQQLDLEDLRDALVDYQTTVTRVFEDSRGFIARYTGDGVLVYFGYPAAMEDDAVSAVQAAQEILRIFEHSPRFAEGGVRVRIGIATGLVLAGEIVGSGVSEEHTVLGRTPNLAARLQGVAGPNQMVVDDQTWLLVRRLYLANTLEKLELKGFRDRLTAYEVPLQQPKSACQKMTDGQFIGRSTEIRQLSTLWDRVLRRHGCFVLIEGEPGIGKSRLVREFRTTVAAEGHHFAQWLCSPHSMHSAFFAVTRYVQDLCGITAGQSAQQRRWLIEESAGKFGIKPSRAERLVKLLGIVEPSSELSFDTPLEGRIHTIELLIDMVTAMARERPAVLVIEDVHAIDPSTLELLQTLIVRIDTVPIMVLATCRPEFVSDNLDSNRIHKISLKRLGDSDCSRLIAELGKLPQEMATEILRKADGIPLFVEEITHAIFEAARLQVSSDSVNEGIPSSLQSLLLARLDRLGSARELAQTAAVIGDQIDLQMLQHVSGRNETALQTDLEILVSAGVLVLVTADNGGRFVFRHMLFQEVAYQTLLRDERRRLHRLVATGMRTLQPEVKEVQPELVARHFTAANCIDEALEYWLLAAERASSMSANTECLAHVEAAMPLVAELSSGRKRERTELALSVVQASALRGTAGPAADRIAEVYERSLVLSESLGAYDKLVSVLNGLYVFNLLRTRYGHATGFANRLLEHANKSGDVTGRMIGHRALGAVSFNTGNLHRANENLQMSLQLYDEKLHGNSAAVIGADHYQVATSFLCITLAVQGKPETALLLHQKELERARTLGHAHNTAQLLVFLVFHTSVAGFPEMTGYCEELDALASEYQFPMMSASGKLFRGSWQLQHRNSDAAVAALSEGWSDYVATGALNYLPYFEMRTAEAWLLQKNYDKAYKLLESSYSRLDESGEHWCLAEWLRLRGEYDRQANRNFIGAKHYFQKSVADAESRGAYLWSLKALRSLGKLPGDDASTYRDKEDELLLKNPELGRHFISQ